MAKKKNTRTVQEPKAPVPETPKAPVKPPVETSETAEPKAPKRRIRIRKKATKKLSAAIICMDPTIQRFI